jgi:threonine aldolase
MNQLTRRGFTSAIGAVVGAGSMAGASAQDTDRGDGPVYLYGDGVELDPLEYATLLHRLCQARKVESDAYLIGGEIESFERHWATLLGKERAVFMPSGTLANQLALRVLAGDRRRVVVSHESHIYNDTGDASQTLSGLTLLPLAAKAATFTLADVEATLARTAGGRVATNVGAIAIESPIRRLSGRMFDWTEARRITAFARERGIGTHLDGARMFIASAYTGIAPAEYAAPFDTVYVSLWKCFNSGQGAILAGPRRLLDGLFHTRRMFGGNLWSGWHAAVVARHFMDGFLERTRDGIRASDMVLAALARHPRAAVERFPNGTNVVRLTLRDVVVRDVAASLAARGIHLPDASPAGVVALNVNETWARRPPADTIDAFERALG